MRRSAVQLTASAGRRSGARTALCAALCLAVLAGCAADGVSSISRNRIYGRYSATEIQWAAGGGRDFHVIVRNNPSALTTEGFEQAVIDAIQGQVTFLVTNFTTTPGDSARLQYRIEFFFDPPQNTNGFALCDPARSLPATDARPGETNVLGALCLRERPLSEAFAHRADAPPGSPEFDHLMSQLIRSLLPRRQPGRRSPSCRTPGACG